VFGAAFAGGTLLLAGLAAALFVPARTWRDETWSFAPSSGEVSEPRGEGPEECPPVDTNAAIACDWLGDGQWLWFEVDETKLRHYPSGRLLPPKPGTRCTYTLAGEGRLGAVCRDTAGAPAAFVEHAAGWRRLAERGDLAPFLAGDPRPISTAEGLVAAAGGAFHVWRPGQGVAVYPGLAGYHGVYHLAPHEEDTVLLAARVLGPNAGYIALKVLAAIAALGGAWLLRRASGHGRPGAVIGGVFAALVVLVGLGLIAGVVLVGMAGGGTR
jgi:hypothetical protein